eukprot:m.387605 g.387605  ORF g.387605 m.387605 type:complete len:493 (+) comp21033_c0_seq7:302-1780(+)
MGKKKGSKKNGKKKGSKKSVSKKKSSTGVKSNVVTAEERLWAQRYKISEASRSVHRANASTLVQENDRLQDDLQTAEREALEVITYFKEQRVEKEREVQQMQEVLRQERRNFEEEKADLKAACERELVQKSTLVQEQNKRIQVLEAELSTLAEWNKNRNDMLAAVEQLKRDSEDAKLEYERYIQTKEEKFKEEKVRLRRETEAEISQLAANAHAVAVAELDDTTVKTYKDKVRLTEEVRINKRECERLAAENAGLRQKLEDTMNTSRDAELLARASVARTKTAEERVKDLEDQVASLETALSTTIQDFDAERSMLTAQVESKSTTTVVELAAAQRALKLKTAENKRIRLLARHIVEQRSEVEQFFHEALGEIRTEIARNRAKFAKESKETQQRQVLEGAKSGVLPPIQTFGRGSTSTNSLQQAFDDAAILPSLTDGSHMDIGDLTWEQKETVLRKLFAKMNAAGSDIRPGTRPSMTMPVDMGLASPPQDAQV